MNLSLDYDNTYTRDPAFWDDFIRLAKSRGHKVYCVTLRYQQESFDVNRDLADKVDGIFFTERKNKHDFMFNHGIAIDVWIDDMPYFIMNNASS